jgi:hypothetical protein
MKGGLATSHPQGEDVRLEPSQQPTPAPNVYVAIAAVKNITTTYTPAVATGCQLKGIGSRSGGNQQLVHNVATSNSHLTFGLEEERLELILGQIDWLFNQLDFNDGAWVCLEQEGKRPQQRRIHRRLKRPAGFSV